MLKIGVFYHHLQAFSTMMVYFVAMNKTTDNTVDLVTLRENAGLTVRELARQLDIHHTTILQWERSGKVAKTEFLVPIASILGVTIEELLGQPKPRRVITPGGKLGQVFKRVSELPRRQQKKVIEMAEAFVLQHENGRSKQAR